LLIGILTISLLSVNCIYSFNKGKLPFRSIYIGNIANNTYRGELKMKLTDEAVNVFSSYGNLSIVDSSKADARLTAEVMEYSRNPDTYDASGNIYTYVYRISVFYKINALEHNVTTSKILKGEIDENSGMDSLAIDNIRNLIDRLMVEF